MENPIPGVTPPNTSKLPLGLNLGQFIGAVSAVAVIVGALLPWAKVMGLISVSGIDGDGQFTLIAAVVALVLIFVKKAPVWISLILGLVVLAISGIDLYDMLSQNQGLTAEMGADNPFAALSAIEIGIGMYLTILGGLGLVAGPIINMYKK